MLQLLKKNKFLLHKICVIFTAFTNYWIGVILFCCKTRVWKCWLKLFGLFNIHISHSGSCWDNHVFDLLFWPCLEMIFFNVPKVLVYATMHPMTQDRHYSDHHCLSHNHWTRVNGMPGQHVAHLTSRRETCILDIRVLWYMTRLPWQP